MLTVLGGLAEFERDLIRTRTGEGRARAIARGQKMGRAPFGRTTWVNCCLRRLRGALADGGVALLSGGRHHKPGLWRWLTPFSPL
jgi:hypothetical protein